MAADAHMNRPHLPAPTRVAILRVVLVLAFAAGWEALSRSGLVFEEAVPSLGRIAAALLALLGSAAFYRDCAVTGAEVALAFLIGSVAGVAVGLVLGASPYLSRAYEPYLNALGPTPKIILFPVLIMMFGTGLGSKIAMGAVSCFFPVALSMAVGMRQINPILIRVATSFGASRPQRLRMVLLPAMTAPIVNSLRLGFGVTLIGVLLAETKLSDRGLGSLLIQSYIRFDLSTTYAIFVVAIIVAVLANHALTRVVDHDRKLGRAA